MDISIDFWLGVLLGVSLGGAVLYRMGKRSAFNLIEQHCNEGKTVEIALQYERDVMNGVIPRG